MQLLPIIYIDADACPVKEEVYRVAGRYAMRVVVVANATMRVPTSPLVDLIVRQGVFPTPRQADQGSFNTNTIAERIGRSVFRGPGVSPSTTANPLEVR